MKLSFQEDVLKYVMQERLGHYIGYLEKDAFDLHEHRIILDLVKGYYARYKVMPTKHSIVHFFNESAEAMGLSEELASILLETVLSLYTDKLEADAPYVEDKLIEFCKTQGARRIFEEFSAELAENTYVSDADIAKMYRKMATLVNLGQHTEQSVQGHWLIKETYTKLAQEGHPTYLQALNNMTAAGGFHTPQLIIWMSEPKGFKTGLTISVAVQYVRMGYNVFYADTENFVDDIIERAEQAMTEMTVTELRDNMKYLRNLKLQYRHTQGEMRAEFFMPKKATLVDVDIKLQQLKEEHNWVPDIIVYDYLDNFEPAGKDLQKRLAIQDVYFHAIRLNVKYGTFAFSPSQVGRQAVNKAVIKMTDFAEDFGKAANAHAAFALCRTDEERKAGVARVVAVMQRKGKNAQKAIPCFIEVDEDRMLIHEITMEQWEERVKIAMQERDDDDSDFDTDVTDV